MSNRLIFFGDSTASAKDISARPETGWAECLEKYLSPDFSLVNLAVNGMSSRKCLETGLFEKGLEMAYDGAWCIIEFGHNENKSDGRYSAPWTGFLCNLTLMASSLEEKGCHVMLLTPIARRRFSAQGEILCTHGEYPQVIKCVAERMDLAFVDMEKLTASYFSRLGPERSKTCFMHLSPGESPNYPEGIADDTHLNSRGAEAVASIFVSHAKTNMMVPFIGGMML